MKSASTNVPVLYRNIWGSSQIKLCVTASSSCGWASGLRRFWSRFWSLWRLVSDRCAEVVLAVNCGDLVWAGCKHGDSKQQQSVARPQWTMTRLWDMWHEWCSRRPDTANISTWTRIWSSTTGSWTYSRDPAVNISLLLLQRSADCNTTLSLSEDSSLVSLNLTKMLILFLQTTITDSSQRVLRSARHATASSLERGFRSARAPPEKLKRFTGK